MYILCVLYKIATDNLWTVHCNDIWYLMLAKFLCFVIYFVYKKMFSRNAKSLCYLTPSHISDNNT